MYEFFRRFRSYFQSNSDDRKLDSIGIKRKLALGIDIDKESGINGYCSIFLPCIWKTNDIFSLTYKSDKSMETKYTTNSGDNIIEMRAYKKTKEIPSYKFKTSSILCLVERSKLNSSTYGLEVIERNVISHIGGIKTVGPCSLNYKVGIDQRLNSFFKLQLAISKTVALTKNIFVSNKVESGLLLGSPHITERFFLGSSIRGYDSKSIYPTFNKEAGGFSYATLNSKFGIKYRFSDLFLFSDIAYCSSSNKIFKGNSNDTAESFGASFGIGVSTSIKTDLIGEKNIEAVISFPMIEGSNTKLFSIGLTADF